jgi:hypothetical protein
MHAPAGGSNWNAQFGKPTIFVITDWRTAAKLAV